MALRPQVQLVQSTALAPTDRIGRYPKHTFNVRSMPFSVTPFGIAPVLPGETLKSLFMESRVITDPIKNPITGWKKDYFFFYVKATTLYGDAIRNMFIDLDDNVELSLTQGAATTTLPYYTAKGGVPYLELAVRSITDTYFRDEGEFYNNKPLINGYPVAQIRETSWMDTLLDKDLVPEQSQIDAAADTGDLERLMLAFEQLRSMGLANITYEDYLASFGINLDTQQELDRPTLLMHTNDFQYPSNTVNPADGTPSSAVSWVFRQGENKKRAFFKEPGFIVGVTVTRPKIFFGGQAGNMAAHMSRAWDWMPELLINMPSHSLKKFDSVNPTAPATATLGPLGVRSTTTDQYFVDMRDLLNHGDQFQNRLVFDPLQASNLSEINGVQLPDSTLNWRYPTEAQVKLFFKTAGSEYIREDGYFALSIMGKQRDATPNANLQLS
jgi:hypothetical protein